MLVTSPARLPPPLRRTRRAEDLRRAGPRAHRAECSEPGAPSNEHHDRGRLDTRDQTDPAELRRAARRAGRKSTRTSYHRVFANNLLKIWPALWTFVTHARRRADQQPRRTRAPRPVIHRKLSHGTRTNNGERFTERALSASATCRQQHTIPLRVPQRTTHRPHPRRPTPHPHLNPRTERLHTLVPVQTIWRVDRAGREALAQANSPRPRATGRAR